MTFGASPPGGGGLVHRLMEFVDKAMVEWEPKFEEWTPAFDQDWNELSNAGETLEQYNVFKKYEKLVARKLDEFASSEGFDDIGACFEEIQRLVADDKVKLAEEMQAMQAKVKAAHDAYEAQKAAAQAAFSGGEGKQPDGSEGKHADNGDGGGGEGKRADGGEAKAGDGENDKENDGALAGAHSVITAGHASESRAIAVPSAPGQEGPPMFLMPVNDSAEDFCRLKAPCCTAMAWIFIPAYCFAVP